MWTPCPGEHLLAYDTREQFIDAILARSAISPNVAHSSPLPAGQRVLSHHSWPASMRRVDALIASQFAKRAAA